jgi:murein DD-endopeptidase MepM/ murein hydrolase activator NlpD
MNGELHRGRVAVAVALIGALVLLCCGGGASLFMFTGIFKENEAVSTNSCGVQTAIDLNREFPRVGSFGDEQMRNAAIIVSVGQEMKVPPRGWVVAIATAIQESYLNNLGHLGSTNDHDSLGLFQQRPSQGWGTPEQIRDPKYSSRKFYEKLVSVSNWEDLSLTTAAQRVQRSAYPNAYARHENVATNIVNSLTNGGARAVGSSVDMRCVSGTEISASGWTSPVLGEIVSGFRTAARPTHHGVDIGAPRGAEIYAASGGRVTQMRCDARGPDGSPWGCGRDGSPSVRGCGWYVDILHAGAIMTRYCHMGSQPRVSVGQTVTAGQVLGQIGSTGNSSGPHLHFEVHRDGDRSSAGAIEPARFMQEMGAPLGDGKP